MIGRLLADQRLRYLLVGAWNTLFGYVFFALLVVLFADDVHYIALVVVSHVVAVVQNYVLYRTVVFRSSATMAAEGVRFSMVYVVALAANLALLPLLVEVAGVPLLVSQAVLVVATVALSYSVNRRFTFRSPTPSPALHRAAAVDESDMAHRRREQITRPT